MKSTAVKNTSVKTTGTRSSLPVGAACCSVLEEPVAEPEAAELARAFAALADPVRLRLFSMIAASGGACSCDLIEPIGKSQPTVSHHTKVLADAGLITGEKAGRWVSWSVVPERLDQLRAALGA
ncbi:MAG TPA: metalloregulator ArsR/SmtB family transcription factor [Acidimicrobiales bacterium]|nr:metalloregulator ArsR/SmtB family transcription factor [Acidimicrobiales bacterium]